MTLNPHIMQTLGRERTADLLRDAAAIRTAAQAGRPSPGSQTAIPPEPRPRGPQKLIPARAEKR
jgi:hypothetical protein